MNRFGSYLTSQKLAKELMGRAEDRIKRDDYKGAMLDVVGALRNYMSATNCIASLLFEKRKHK